MKVKLLSLKLANFLFYPKDVQEIVFADGFTGIIGENGVGKSTLLDAISFCLYKEETKGLGNDIFKENGLIEVKFDVDSYVVIFKKEFVKGKVVRSFKFGEKPWKLGISDAEFENLVYNHIGLDKSTFVKTFFIRQEETQDFIRKTGTPRLEELIKFLDLGFYSKCEKLAYDKMQEIYNELGRLKENLKIKQENLARLNLLKVSKNCEQIRVELGSVAKSIEAQVIVLTGIEGKIDTINIDYIEFAKLKTTLNEKSQRRALANQKINEITSALSTKKDTEVKLTEMKKSMIGLVSKGNAETLQKSIDVLNEKLKQVAVLETNLKNADNKIVEIEKNFESISTNIKSSHDDLVGKLETFKKSGTVPFNKGKLSVITFGISSGKSMRMRDELEKKMLLPQFIDETQNEMENIRSKLKEISNTNKKFTSDSSNMQNILDRIDDLKKQNEKLLIDKIKQKQEIEGQIGGFQEKIKSLNKDSIVAEITSSKDLITKITRLEKEINILDAKMQNFATIELQLKAYVDDFQKIDVSIMEIKKGIALFESMDLESKKTSINAELSSNRSKLDELKLRENTLKNQLELSVTFNKESLNAEITALTKQIDDKTIDSSRYSRLRDAFNKKGIVLSFIKQIIPVISYQASKHISPLSNSRFTAIELLLNSRDTIDVIAYRNGKPVHVEYVSGGEKVMVSAALHFAFCQVLVEATNTMINSLIIDEGNLGNLSSANVERFLERLEYLKGFISNIGMITHLKIIPPYFNHVYTIYADQNGMSRILKTR